MMRRLLSGFAVVMMLGASGARADVFQKPTTEELKMTSLPGYPGAPAVVLFREELTKDDLHVVQHYDRIKILTDAGKKYANVELRFVSFSDFGKDDYSDDKSVGEIVGRTIHADGTVIPFTGKPYLKTMEKGAGLKYRAKVFTLPDVEVGSIIEYRYATRYNDSAYEPPDWYVQGELYLKLAHYQWLPTQRELMDPEHGPVNSITWFPILPVGAKIERHETPGTIGNGPQQVYDLTVKDVAPQVEEEYMPPISSYSYRVMFNFSAFRTAAEFWKANGKDWSKRLDAFTNPNGDLKSKTEAVVAGATTQDQKLQKIYAAVMEIENTGFTREHDKREDKAVGVGTVKTADDVLTLKRGTATQLTELFVGMARAAGMKAYLMAVPDRSKELFTPGWQSFQQFDDLIAIAVVDGKEAYFDPGSRYCEYGHLAWEHTFVRGLRQTDGGTDFGEAPGETYKANRTSRVANLQMDEHGEMAGKIDVTFTGSAALTWRHRALRGDEESLHHGLRTMMEDRLPKSLEVKVGEIKNLANYTLPLTVSYTVKGTAGTPTGKRLVVPADLFVAGDAAEFPHEKREQPVYFHYPHVTQDALRLNFPKGYEVEGVPEAAKFQIASPEAYDLTVTTTPTSFTTRRNHIQAEVVVDVKDYAELRKFYSRFESKDQETVVLKTLPAGTSAAPAVPAGN